ncbi:caspase family protein [Leisingera caerulea]|uniref:caspase family protein n=1 Tax=Leisingera caerulea TaxID=506591 RepID=UPI0021A8E2C0|nr:caspase family protein [Leisingera caerulea]UWQ84377.1 caspase family protein [Leisingera caerulea]
MSQFKFDRRAEASRFSHRTHALIIGISDYNLAEMAPLPACEHEAKKLVETLSDGSGCAVPDDQIASLLGSAATRNTILKQLEELVTRAQPSDSIFVYFAGHGLARGGSFVLCTNETGDPAGVQASDLEQVLSDAVARGILVVVDCCGGAGLAENAPNVFYRLEDSDYRVFISASRASQSSWELPGDKASLFTPHLIDVLAGTEIVGKSGEIFFSELFDHLHTSVQASAEKLLGDRNAQEPVFSGSYGRDPLLFLHKDLSLSQIILRTERLTRADFQRRVRTLVGGITVLTALGVGGHWAWQDGQQFLRLDRDQLTLSHGHPSLSSFGFPSEDWIYPLGPSSIAIAQSGPVGEGFVFQRRDDPNEVLADLLTPTAEAQVMLWQKRDAEARRIFLANKGTFLSSLEGQILLPDLVTAEDEIWLKEQISATDGSTAEALIAALTKIDQEAAVVALEQSAISDDAGHQLNLLKAWQAPCGPELQRWTEAFLSKEGANFALPAIVQTTVLTGCEFPVGAAIVAQPHHVESAVYALRLTNEDSLRELAKIVAEQVRSDLETNGFDVFDTSLPNRHRMLAAHTTRLARYLGEMPCFPGWVSRFNPDVLDDISQRARLDAIVATARDCPNAVVEISTGPVALHVSIKFGDAEPQNALYVPTAPTLDASILPVLDSLIEANAGGIEDALRDVLAKTDSAELRYHIAERAREIRASGSEALDFTIVDAPRLDVSLLRWLATEEPEQAGAQLVERLLQKQNSELIEGLVHIQISEDDKSDLLAAVATAEPQVRIPIVSLIGTPAQAAELFTERSPKVRDIAARYAPLRIDWSEIQEIAEGTSKHADPFLGMASDRYDEGKKLDALMGKTPEWARHWRAMWLDHSFIDDYAVSLLFARTRASYLDQ